MTDYLGKRRTRQHIISDLSVNHVERQALLCGFSIQRTTHDYGIDLEITTFNRNGEVDVGKILAQIKATSRLKLRNKAVVSCRIERAHLLHWLAEPLPVVLILYDAKQEVGYWLYIQSYFRRLADFNLFEAGKTITVNMPVANVVNRRAMRKFARFRDRVLQQMSKVTHDEN